MDSNAVCNKQFELGNTPTYLYGSGAKNENNPPRTCIMTFSSENIREKRKFRIEVMEANFHKNPDDNSQAATTEFFVFDGASTSNYRLVCTFKCFTISVFWQFYNYDFIAHHLYHNISAREVFTM